MDFSNTAPIWQKAATRFLEAGLSGNTRQIELAALTAIRELKPSNPEAANLLARVLARHRTPASVARGLVSDPPPTDADTTMALVKVETLVEPQPQPILAPAIQEEVARFVRERKQANRLLAEGFLPPATLLLSGEPGTGKTMLARWLAAELNMKLATLDLATAISSFLGRTGANLRRILDYSRATPTLLFLDEFDSLAKRRDDSSDIGELKRVVNVLLKELEDWPETSVLVAATNHSGILDPAAFRRFERTIVLPVPGIAERLAIINRGLGNFQNKIEAPLVQAIAALCEGSNASILDQLSRAIVRRHLVDQEELKKAALAEVASCVPRNQTSKERAQLLKKVHSLLGEGIPLRIFSDLFGITPSTVHHHLKKTENAAA